MCLTIPAKVISIGSGWATVRDSNQIRKINLQSVSNEDVRKGDWILYANDFAVKKISRDEAAEIVDLLDSYHPKINEKNLSEKYKTIILKSKKGKLGLKDIEYLLRVEGEEKEALFAEADVLRKTYLKDFICIHGIIEFSNYCKNDCFYCGLRAQNKKIRRYRMKPKEIADTAIKAVRKGYKLLVLQSGEDHYYDTEMLCGIIREIKSKCEVFIFISIGERDYKAYKKLKEAGASGVLFRFETSNKVLFSKYHKRGKSWESRVKHLKFFKKLGYYIATGSITGLPGQKISDIAKDILMIKKWASMVSAGPFVPSPSTPFSSDKAGDPDMQYKSTSIIRLLMPNGRIPVVTALETLEKKQGRKKALLAGANSLMFNVTPKKYRENYKIYENRFFRAEKLWEKYGLFRQEESYEMLKERMEEEMG